MQGFFNIFWYSFRGPCGPCWWEKHPMELIGLLLENQLQAWKIRKASRIGKVIRNMEDLKMFLRQVNWARTPNTFFLKIILQVEAKIDWNPPKSADSAKFCGIMNSDFIDDKQQIQMYVSSDLCKMRETRESIMPVKTIANMTTSLTTVEIMVDRPGEIVKKPSRLIILVDIMIWRSMSILQHASINLLKCCCCFF